MRGRFEQALWGFALVFIAVGFLVMPPSSLGDGPDDPSACDDSIRCGCPNDGFVDLTGQHCPFKAACPQMCVCACTGPALNGTYPCLCQDAPL